MSVGSIMCAAPPQASRHHELSYTPAVAEGPRICTNNARLPLLAVAHTPTTSLTRTMRERYNAAAGICAAQALAHKHAVGSTLAHGCIHMELPATTAPGGSSIIRCVTSGPRQDLHSTVRCQSPGKHQALRAQFDMGENTRDTRTSAPCQVLCVDACTVRPHKMMPTPVCRSANTKPQASPVTIRHGSQVHLCMWAGRSNSAAGLGQQAHICQTSLACALNAPKHSSRSF